MYSYTSRPTCRWTRVFRYIKADSRFVPSQLETALLCNNVSHWLGASLESALYISHTWIMMPMAVVFCQHYDHRQILAKSELVHHPQCYDATCTQLHVMGITWDPFHKQFMSSWSNLPKWYDTHMWKIIFRPCHTFAHATTAKLSWHM